MDDLIAAFKELFAETTKGGGEIAKTAQIALDSTDWKDWRNNLTPSRSPISDKYLGIACANSGQAGSASNKLAISLVAATDQLEWRGSSKNRDRGPDIDILSQNFVIATIIGAEAPLYSESVYAGFSLQAPDVYYPSHAHFAEESYWIIGGDADWRVGGKPWHAVCAGDTVYHEHEVRHAMQTNELPMLTVWLWTSHLDSEVLIVREPGYDGLADR